MEQRLISLGKPWQKNTDVLQLLYKLHINKDFRRKVLSKSREILNTQSEKSTLIKTFPQKTSLLI